MGEARKLLDDMQANEALTPMLVVGDFNQTRQRDYSSEEWGIIQHGKSKQALGEPEVCALFEAHSFKCSLDKDWPPSMRNWPAGAYPPPTHWTGMAIDYSLARGLNLHGVYVSPTHLSDHSPVICDWHVLPC